MRKLLLAAAIFAAATLPAAAGGGYHGGGGFHNNGGYGHGGGRWHNNGQWLPWAVGAGVIGGAIIADSCWRTVADPYGRFRRVWVCN